MIQNDKVHNINRWSLVNAINYSDIHETAYTIRKEAMTPVVVEMFGIWDEEYHRQRIRDALDENFYFILGNAFKYVDPETLIYDPSSDNTAPLHTQHTDKIGTIRISVEDDDVHISNFQILPAYQGYGIGGEIIQFVCNASKDVGYTNVSLRVLKKNRALALYERMGFSHVDADEFHYTLTKRL